MLERERWIKKEKERAREREREFARPGCSSMHSVSTDRIEKEENKG